MQQIKHYIDGRLDVLASKHNGKRHSAEDEAASVATGDALWIGAGAPADRFRGQFDELFIADRPLTPYEIRHLMAHNTPAMTEMLAAE